MDPERNFITVLSSNYDKLRNKDVVEALWKEVLSEGKFENAQDQIIQYSCHHPVDTDAYLELLNDLYDQLDKQQLRTIDGYLKTYITTFLYYCTDVNNCQITDTTKVLAAILYLKLASHPDIGKIFFVRNLYKLQLVLTIHIAEKKRIQDRLMISLVNQIKECFDIKLEPLLVRGSANAFVGVVIWRCTTPIQDIKDLEPVSSHCLCLLKELILKEDDGNNLKYITASIFRCLKSSVMESVPNRDNAFNVIRLFIQNEFRNGLSNEKSQYFLDAFCEIWGQEDFNYYEKAIIIMNLFKEDHYKELLRRMILYTQSKNHLRFMIHVMHLLVMILKNLPPFQLHKVEVLYSSALRNILMQILNNDQAIATKAIETLATICLMKNNELINMIFNQIQANGRFININIETLLLSFTRIVDEKWGTSPKNQHLLVIMVKFLSHSRTVNSELVIKTLKLITKDCTPFSLKPSLPILHKLFCVMSRKDDAKIANAILKIIFKCAMHQDSTSVEYLDHIFKSLLYPSENDDVRSEPKYYSQALFTSDFEYRAFFIKCKNKIRREHVSCVIDRLNYEETGCAILLCCILEFCKYDGSAPVAAFFVDNFREISIRDISGPLSSALCTMLDQKVLTAEDIPQLDVLQSLAVEALFEQTFLVPCFKPAYDLFAKIRNMLHIDPQNYIPFQLHAMISQKTVAKLVRSRYIDGGLIILTPEERLRELSESCIFLYLNEACLIVKQLPEDRVIKILEGYIENEAFAENHPEMYVQLVTLFTSMAMMCRSKAPLALKHLWLTMNKNNQTYKVLGLKLLLSLSQEITHEYEEIQVFALKEIVAAGPCLTKYCALALEELVHNDYLKLSPENFFKVVFPLGCDHHTIFMKNLLMKRFVASNQNDIAKYYIQTVVYVHLYTKFSTYPISQQFEQELLQMTIKIDDAQEIFSFLFLSLPIQKKINIWTEIAEVLDEVIAGKCKVENGYYNVLNDLIHTYRYRRENDNHNRSITYLEMCQLIEKQIINFDPSHPKECFYFEFEREIRKCTLTLLKLLFLEDVQLAENIDIILFDSLMHWIDFFKAEIIHYIHIEKGKDYCQYFRKLLQYYKKNKTRFIIPISFSLDC